MDGFRGNDTIFLLLRILSIRGFASPWILPSKRERGIYLQSNKLFSSTLSVNSSSKAEVTNKFPKKEKENRQKSCGQIASGSTS